MELFIGESPSQGDFELLLPIPLKGLSIRTFFEPPLGKYGLLGAVIIGNYVNWQLSTKFCRCTVTKTPITPSKVKRQNIKKSFPAMK
jgi:hypothetical protein